MPENRISTVMMKGIFEELAQGHQLPKRLGQGCNGDLGSKWLGLLSTDFTGTPH
jgi:hypothetical protein